MATELYKAGSGHERDGVRCDIAKVEPKQVQNYLEAGWKLNPKDCYEENVVSLPDVEVKRRGRPPKAV